MSKQALGRGFDSLIPVNFAVNDVASPGEHVKKIDISKIVANPDQPRKEFSIDSLNELALSIKQHGVIQPIVVTPMGDNNYRIVAGERRFRASKIAKLKTIPAIVRNHKELDELEISLVENVQRVDLSPIEQALSIVRLHEQFSMSYKDISKKLSKAETTISNIVRLLQLPKDAIEALQNNRISEGHARAILALKTDEKLQKELLNKIITQQLTVRDAEAFVQNSKSIQKSKSTVKYDNSEYIRNILNSIKSKDIKEKLSIKEKSSGKGTVVFKYNSKEELEEYINKLK
jgi:ParB family chromosome partitioning protein